MTYRASNGMGGVRVKRDRLLAETDHLAMADSPLSEGMRIAFGLYRQALRDVTKQELPVTWPEYPTSPAPVPEAPVPEVIEVPTPSVSYSARIEEYRNDGESDLDMKKRLLKEIDKKVNVLSGPRASDNIRAEYRTLHEMLYHLKDV